MKEQHFMNTSGLLFLHGLVQKEPIIEGNILKKQKLRKDQAEL